MHYLLLPDLERRTAFIETPRRVEIDTAFHGIALHSAPAGRRHARAHGADTRAAAQVKELIAFGPQTAR